MFSFIILLLFFFSLHNQSPPIDQHNRSTHNQHKWINTTDQQPNKYTLHGKPTIATHNLWQTQPQSRFSKPTTHDKPSHNHGNPKTPPITTVNPQKSQTQNNQKIKKETRSDRRDCEPNATTTKPTSSC